MKKEDIQKILFFKDHKVIGVGVTTCGYSLQLYTDAIFYFLNPLKVFCNEEEQPFWSLKDHIIQDIFIDEGDEMVIEFDSGYKLWMDLKKESYSGAEALNVNFNNLESLVLSL